MPPTQYETEEQTLMACRTEFDKGIAVLLVEGPDGTKHHYDRKLHQFTLA